MNPFTLITGALATGVSSAFVGGVGEGESQGQQPTQPERPTQSLKSNKERVYIVLFAFLVVAVIILIVFIVLHQISIDKIKKDLKAVQNTNNSIVNTNNSIVNTNKKIIIAVDRIGTHIKATDTTFSYDLLNPPKKKFGGRDNFVQIPYQNELNLFKTLSPEDQYEYLHMDKETKRAKYSNML